MNQTTQPETGAALALPDTTSLAEIFAKRSGLDPLLSKLEGAVRVEAKSHDPATRKGRDALKSLAYKISQSKAELDRQGLALTEEARKKIDAVNVGRKQIKERLDSLRDAVKQPVIDWEAAEEGRVAKHKLALSAFDLGRVDALCSTEMIRSVVEEISLIDIGEDWQEYREIAATAKEQALTKFRADFEAAEQREAEQAELARLRAEAADRDRRKAEEEAARLAEETARQAAEDAERRRVEAEKAEALRREQIEREKAEAVERATNEAAERAAKEKREAEDRHAQELAEAKRAAEFAAQQERNRLARIKAEEDAFRAKREADATHRQKILREIAEALLPIPRENIPQALLDGRIPHVKVLI